MSHLENLKERIKSIPQGGITIPTQSGEFTMHAVIDRGNVLGVAVDNLGNEPFLPFDVFVVALSLLEASEQTQVEKGNAMNAKLGDPELTVNTVEGLVAKVVYGKNIGDSVFRRITPISRILQWANICNNERGYLSLRN